MSTSTPTSDSVRPLLVPELFDKIQEYANKFYVLRYEYEGESFVHADTNVMGLLNKVLITWVNNWSHLHPIYIDIEGGFKVNNRVTENKVLYVWSLGHCTRSQLFPEKRGVTRDGYTWIANGGFCAYGTLKIEFDCPSERISHFINSDSPVKVANDCISPETMQEIVTYMRDEIGEREPLDIEVSVMQWTPMFVPSKNFKRPGSLSISSNPSFEMALQSAGSESTGTSPSS